MSTIIAPTPVDQDRDINPTRIVHIVDRSKFPVPMPGNVALCGARTAGRPEYGRPVDCVVCAELA